MNGEPILDFIVLGVPPDVVTDSEEFRTKVNNLAHYKAMAQYKERGIPAPKALVMDPIDWLVTSDWRDVERFQPAHDCAACRAGNDQAIATLKEHPERRLALGNLRYWEIW